MKSLFLLVALLFAVALSSSSAVVSKASNPAKKQKAVAQFNDPVRLQGVRLKGEYLFVHDDAAMTRGEACTFVYKGDAEIASQLVVSFHCTPVQRQKVGGFVIRTEQLSPDVNEVREFQFGGETEAHAVPMKYLAFVF
ncbi:MAG TPA: hypothetical protein DC054_01170 [Blastocatellia bacterium]|nr:hypothetical protein [Blastocatellia bacterium]